jgi:hypothetical protein
MTKTFTEFQQLISLTLQHIEEEYPPSTNLFCSTETFKYFEGFKIKQPNKNLYHAEPKKNLPFHELLDIAQRPLRREKDACSVVIKTASSEEIKLPTPKEARPTFEFSENIKRKLEKTIPNIKIIREVPSDEQAIILAQQWMTTTTNANVLIFNFSSISEHRIFWENVKYAIEAHFCSCAVIDVVEWESKNNWESFFKLHNCRFILGSQEILRQTHLLTHFKEIPATKDKFLKSHPYFGTYPASEYIKKPDLKKSLWKMLCKQLNKD